ncbi:NDP-sugar synthase [Paenibacillus cisolokensis]|jgi:mannose-1-phosphate guanylyltransferase|uniref:Nucleotidyltransferase n=1 Tax=Paenibacillus cisolokensis TaxID=1658519 RepID=A0ABQ4N030_9BACL|nr:MULTISPECIES: NDP-sugar synthase [Paenibacillus]ALS27875.1 alcohol dehydrogenase [Paenibacillus sp. 32O-W]GIQ61535.1 nucleotidyltransferase [Paenibacillus cisolokensis]
MNALLLAGGLGTRLRPLTENLPKPMALVANRPWLEHLIVHLKKQGIRHFVIAVKHYPEVIENYFGTGEKWGVNIQYAVEQTLLGTAGAIKNAEPYLDDRFIVINADIVHEIEIEPLLAFHKRHGGGVTIGLTEVDDPTHYGVVEQDGEGRILRFVEKPRLEEAPSNRINAGIYVMDKEMLRYIPEQQEVSIERETFPLLIEKGEGVYGTVISGYWMDMGTKERYRRIHWDLLNRAYRLPLPGRQNGKGIWIGKNCDIHSGVLLIPPVLIGDNVKIGERSIIGPFSVIGNDCVIGKHVRCAETIMWDRCLAHNGVVMNNCIFGYDLEIGSKHILHEAVMSRIGVLQA